MVRKARPRHLFNALATRMRRMLHGDSGSGLLLIVAAGAALTLANSDLAPIYHEMFHKPLSWTPLARLDTWHLWINDALMAVFFFVIGLEIKREVLDGYLSTPQRRRLPVLAALCGMAVPALVYLAIAGGDILLRRGWAIPAATDIAFALGILAIVARGLPSSLRLFLLTVAIVDDLGAVVVIALFYTGSVKLWWLGAALAVLAAMALLNRLRVSRARYFLLLAVALWYCVLHSGVHATIAGVLAAFTIPLRLTTDTYDSLLLRLEHALAPWSAYLIVPLFGFANAGVTIGERGFAQVLDPLPMAIAAGLVIGKQAGIFLSIVLAERTGFAPRPAGATWAQVWGVSVLCGIGFTMSLFIGALAFPGHPELYEEAKIGVLTGTLISALVGTAILRATRPYQTPTLGIEAHGSREGSGSPS
ncbi:MAG: Na+/H+ antiporter NhaA [Novosphingobium sp.]|nr:Na+/H+ antiporter NhaA [Novosphingobium sp.]